MTWLQGHNQQTSACPALLVKWTAGQCVCVCVYRERAGGKVSLQGNMDPCALYAPKVNSTVVMTLNRSHIHCLFIDFNTFSVFTEFPFHNVTIYVKGQQAL